MLCSKKFRWLIVPLVIILAASMGRAAYEPALGQGLNTTVFFPWISKAPERQILMIGMDINNHQIYNLYLVGDDGGGLTNLTNGTERMGYFAVSPDGEEIAFTWEKGDNLEIYSVNRDGRHLVNLTNDPGQDFDMAWSPNGDRIAFTSYRNAVSQVYVMNADGSHVTPLGCPSWGCAWVDWSPVNDQIAFTSDGGYMQEIYVMNADGTGLTRLTNNQYQDLLPLWSPDGTKIVYSSDQISQMSGFLDILVMNADGTGSIALTNSGQAFQPDWSPDGTKIAFYERVGQGPEDFGIFTINPNGTEKTCISCSFGLSEACFVPDWSPDGTRILCELLTGTLVIMNADGSGFQTFDFDFSVLSPQWLPE